MLQLLKYIFSFLTCEQEYQTLEGDPQGPLHYRMKVINMIESNQIFISQFVWCQRWYTSRIWLQNQFQTWASTVEQNWGCRPTKWPDMIRHMSSFMDYFDRQLLIRHNMTNKIMNRLFFMQIPPCPLALYRLCLFSEVSHQKHSCSCCRSESRKSIFLVGQLGRQTIDKIFSLQYEF